MYQIWLFDLSEKLLYEKSAMVAISLTSGLKHVVDQISFWRSMLVTSKCVKGQTFSTQSI